MNEDIFEKWWREGVTARIPLSKLTEEEQELFAESPEVVGPLINKVVEAEGNEVVKAEIVKWIEAHNLGVIVGQDMAAVAGNEISGDVSYVQVRYLDFKQLKEEVSGG